MLLDVGIHSRIIYLPRLARYTAEAAERMYDQVERQLREFLNAY